VDTASIVVYIFSHVIALDDFNLIIVILFFYVIFFDFYECIVDGPKQNNF